jgi:hypothetical protein
MLILSAAYQSYLRPLVDGQRLKSLFALTIKILQASSGLSPQLEWDVQQLE